MPIIFTHGIDNFEPLEGEVDDNFQDMGIKLHNKMILIGTMEQEYYRINEDSVGRTLPIGPAFTLEQITNFGLPEILMP